MIIYNHERNEVIVKGCSSCPFYHSEQNDKLCLLSAILSCDVKDLLKSCPIMRPNFKFTRETKLFNIIK